MIDDDPDVAAAQALVPKLRSRAEQAERDRRLPPDVVDALRRAGFLRLATPLRSGGRAAGLRTAVEVCRVLAHGDASASWVVGIAYGGNLFASQFPDSARTLLWGRDADAFACGAANPSGTVRRVPDGLVLSGLWPFISGIHHAPAVLLGVVWQDDRDEPQRGLALVRAGEIVPVDTWFMAGMRGTGSDTAVAEDLHVPDERLLSFVDIASGVCARRHPDEPRVFYPTSINLPLVGTGIGIAQTALGHVVDRLSKGKRSASPLHERAADMPAHQLHVADAAVLIDTARLHALRAADELDHAGRTGLDLGLEDRARIRMDMSHAMRCARSAVGLLVDTAGASGLADGTELQRAWRDIETASRHAALSAETSREIYGRALLGAELPANPVI